MLSSQLSFYRRESNSLAILTLYGNRDKNTPGFMPVHFITLRRAPICQLMLFGGEWLRMNLSAVKLWSFDDVPWRGSVTFLGDFGPGYWFSVIGEK
ncbi:hypothetical protein C4D60_Mb00t19620 [Musa balbisiana]|uniref:Uncharacterized protein n=1 Tax=Musa balbisiana TaxID=52838 RepID=A0A4S8I482_MUSBA|nr:hypothetical protein C4D60_Mb00t19620 [Musa balbisiana]